MARPVQVLTYATVAIVVLAASGQQLAAQTVRGLDAPGAGGAQAPSPSFLIEEEAKIKGDRIKQQTYRSQAVGKNRNWDLDIGRFQPPINDDPNGLAEDLEDSDYSGMRLRLPFRGRTGQ